jgi:hypothetical protein
MPKTRIRAFISNPPEQKFAVAAVDGFSMSIVLHPADASVGQLDVTVTSLPSLIMSIDLGTPVVQAGALIAPSNLRFE